VHQRKVQDLLQARARERPAYERFVSQNLCAFSISLERESGFQVSASAHSAEDFTVARFTTCGGRGMLDRTAADVRRDSSARYGFYFPVSGTLEIVQRDRRGLCGPGAMAFLSTTEPFSFQKMGDNDTMYFFMPQDFVDHRILGAADNCGRVFDPQDGIPKLLTETVRAFHTGSASMATTELGRISRIVGDLAILALEGATDVRSNASPVRAANLVRAKRIIRARCGDSDLRPAVIARECGLSLRYLHDLFKDEDCTVGEYLLAERLKKAQGLLKSSPPSTTRITDICIASGFSNFSHFSAAFRRAFACSPKDVLRGRL
jgi:AraC-like DNA-binding protein